VVYVRCSTQRQDFSPASQRKLIYRFAAKHCIQVVAEHQDFGVSGAAELSDRPGLIHALQALRDDDAGRLLVARRDRLGRDVGVVAVIEAEVARAGAVVSSADGAGNGNDGNARFLKHVMDAVAQLEREQIRDRITAGLAVRKQAGRVTGRVPLGFELGDDGHSLIESRTEQRAAQLARRLRKGGLSLAAIGERLDEAGHATRAGSRWHPQQVHRLLRVSTLKRRCECA